MPRVVYENWAQRGESAAIGARIDTVSAELNVLLAEAEGWSVELSSDSTTDLVAVTTQSPAAVKKKMTRPITTTRCSFQMRR